MLHALRAYKLTIYQNLLFLANSSPIDSILAVVIVWRLGGKMIRTAPWCVV